MRFERLGRQLHPEIERRSRWLVRIDLVGLWRNDRCIKFRSRPIFFYVLSGILRNRFLSGGRFVACRRRRSPYSYRRIEDGGSKIATEGRPTGYDLLSSILDPPVRVGGKSRISRLQTRKLRFDKTVGVYFEGRLSAAARNTNITRAGAGGLAAGGPSLPTGCVLTAAGRF